MNNKRVIVWFRSDLRLHDNEAMHEAISSGAEIYPIYVFDDRVFKNITSYALRKTDKFRAKFILESVADLQSSLAAIGSNLIIRSGLPEEVISDLAKDLKTSWVFCNRERTDEEVKVQDRLEKNLWAVGQEVRFSRGKMLYYTADLPFPVTHTPDTFTQFRKEVEKIVPVREPLPAPTSMIPVTEVIAPSELPTMASWGFTDQEIRDSENVIFHGGEQAGKARLNKYIWDTEHLAHYKETRNGLLGKDYSSKFSVYLAHGCLSPKMIYSEIVKYESDRIKNESTYHLIFELMWRDFFRLMGKKHGNDIFKKSGIKGQTDKSIVEDDVLFRIWAEGRTGMPFVDAAMIELNTTGFMSNRSRQNVASFLINDLHLNWQMGASYFESMLVDYDPCSNWGNWNYLAGVGNDPREGRHFNLIRQAKKYDPDGAFVKFWIPALKDVPDDRVHRPFLMTYEEQVTYNCILQKDYPDLCISKEQYL